MNMSIKQLELINRYMCFFNPHYVNKLSKLCNKEDNMELTKVYKVVRKTNQEGIYESSYMTHEHKLIYPIHHFVADKTGMGIFAFETYAKACEYLNWLKKTTFIKGYSNDDYEIMRAEGVAKENQPTEDIKRKFGIGVILMQRLAVITPAPLNYEPWTEWEKEEEKPIYRVGDRIIIKSASGEEEYLIARTGADTICLFDINDGNRWADPQKVENDLSITSQELNDIVCELSYYDWHKKAS